MAVALIIMGSLGLVIGVGLAVASKIFYVYVDPLIVEVDEALPGANCGGCGYPGCSSNAEAIVAGKAAPNSCVAAGQEVAEAIAEILGVTIEAREPDIAKPGCTYGLLDADTKFIYDGLNDCKAAALLNGGMKVCSVGCLGLGSCVKACQFGALSMGQDGLPVVDENICTGCGACERTCPKNIINLSSVTRRIMLEYTTDMCTTPCQRVCPAGINISEYINQIAQGNYHQAVQVIKERNPFPSVIGRICPRPCELECRRKYVDEPVAINFLKRFASDFEKEHGERILPYKAPETNRKIAVVGGGVEGLSAAFFSARLGHEPTVFEAGSKLGGLLRMAIARYRLSPEILDWDIDGILEVGVRAETGKSLGKEITVASLLKDGFESVFIALGGWDSRLAGQATVELKEPIPGIRLLIDVLKTDQNNDFVCDRDVVIAGGGRLAFEAARTCKNLGAENIYILFRELPKTIGIKDTDIEDIKNEGVKVIFNAGIISLAGEEEKLNEIEYIEFDTLSKKTIPAQTLIVSSGRFPELIFTKLDTDENNESDEPANTPLRWKGVEPYKPSASDRDLGLFSEVDPKTDFSAAIKALAAGRRAAVSIHQIMYQTSPSVPNNIVTQHSVVQNVDHVEGVKENVRHIMPLDLTDDLVSCKEIEKGFSENAAVNEAKRCLQCGLICYRTSDN